MFLLAKRKEMAKIGEEAVILRYFTNMTCMLNVPVSPLYGSRSKNALFQCSLMYVDIYLTFLNDLLGEFTSLSNFSPVFNAGSLLKCPLVFLANPEM